MPSASGCARTKVRSAEPDWTDLPRLRASLFRLLRGRLKPRRANRYSFGHVQDLFKIGFIADVLVALFRASVSDDPHLGEDGIRGQDGAQVEHGRPAGNGFHRNDLHGMDPAAHQIAIGPLLT